MIHNPQVNAGLQRSGVLFMQDSYGKQLVSFESLTNNDVVIIPAFGTTLAIEEKLNSIGINTTCPFVEKVWNRSEQIAKKNYSILVHGKPAHEETRATFPMLLPTRLTFKEIAHYNFHTKEELTTTDFLPSTSPIKILITSGASCPDAIVEDAIERLIEITRADKTAEEMLEVYGSA